MALYLEPEEKSFLISLVNGLKPKEYWLKDTILKKMDAEDTLIEERDLCEHTFGEYTGKRVCCTKCGALGEGMGESWDLVD